MPPKRGYGDAENSKIAQIIQLKPNFALKK